LQHYPIDYLLNDYVTVVAGDMIQPLGTYTERSAGWLMSPYPAAIQQDYAVFTQKCSQCHKLSRPINSDFALPDEWSRYIHRMMSKPGSGIDSGSGAKIYDFLVYDSSVRKKAMVDAKLAKASPAEKAAAEAKIKEVVAKYK
jgi:hypothetical protein